MPSIVVVGANWGDEGKGRIVDFLAEDASASIRFQGGNNAGHTVVNDFGTFKLHQLPSGIFNPDCIAVLGPGMVISPAALSEEMAEVKEAGIDVNRPEAATAVKKERANILVAISDKGDIWINKRKVDVRSVQANIERLKAENPQGTVVIQADKKATTDTLIKVMDSARAAGVYDVSIAAKEA